MTTQTTKRYRSTLEVELLDEYVDVERLKDCMVLANVLHAETLQKLLDEQKVSSRGSIEKGRNIWIGTKSGELV